MDDEQNGISKIRSGINMYILLISICCFILSGCNVEKQEHNSGVVNIEDSTIVWMTTDSEIDYLIKFDKADSYSSSLTFNDKTVLLYQNIKVDSKLFQIKTDITKGKSLNFFYLNGKKVLNIEHKIDYIRVGVDSLDSNDTVPKRILDEVKVAIDFIPATKSSESYFWLILGLTAQLLFTSRMVVQWVASERASKSVVPILFWYLSLAGSTLLLSYSIYKQDPVFIIGQSFGFIVYIRNLILIKRKGTT